jgi:mannose-6-phosphate isomerase-like protein (cupin superfamily)
MTTGRSQQISSFESFHLQKFSKFYNSTWPVYYLVNFNLSNTRNFKPIAIFVYILLLMKSLVILAIIYLFSIPAFSQTKQPYILEHENQITKSEPGTHNGGGNTTGYSFFSKADDLKMVFRKRVLHPGSAIGYHLQTEDEIYYIVSGAGEMRMNGKTFPVKIGDAILTRPGSSHGLKETGDADLAIIIAYQNK